MRGYPRMWLNMGEQQRIDGVLVNGRYYREDQANVYLSYGFILNKQIILNIVIYV